MTGAPTDRWRRIEELLAAALDREPGARDRFLDAACAGDSDLRREVASLLAAHDRSGALDRLAPEVASITAELRGTAAMLAGRTIGHYQVLEPVADGGMGVVYKAVDTRLGRTVALKFLKPRLDGDQSAAERFRQEARAAGALEHPNICTIHDVGETEDGRLYLAMPLYDGETLERRIARGPLPIDEATDIAVQVLRGLGKAHGRGIIHRDIKPANVFITADGVVKLLDFGIAKLADVSLTGPASRPLGTVAYMSPEQAHGTPVDHRTDIWSLGAVLYEMLSGRRPYPRGVPEAKGEGRSSPPASLTAQRPEVSPALEQVAMKALERSPADRFASADEFLQALVRLDSVPNLSLWSER
jgi:serine/threonine-protein kinase